MQIISHQLVTNQEALSMLKSQNQPDTQTEKWVQYLEGNSLSIENAGYTVMSVLDKQYQEIYANLTKKDKFNICNIPFGVDENGCLKFELCDLYLAVENIKDKLSQDQIEILYSICVSISQQPVVKQQVKSDASPEPEKKMKRSTSKRSSVK